MMSTYPASRMTTRGVEVGVIRMMSDSGLFPVHLQSEL